MPNAPNPSCHANFIPRWFIQRELLPFRSCISLDKAIAGGGAISR